MDGLIDRAESKEVVLLFARSLLCASLAGYKVARPRFVIDPFLPRETHKHTDTYIRDDTDTTTTSSKRLCSVADW